MATQIQRLVPQTHAPVQSYPELIQKQIEFADNDKPSAFCVRTQMVSRGHTETLLAASQQMTVRLKAYASGGENTLHSHRNEDHVFIVLKGSVEFFDEEGSLGIWGANQGILIPKGSVYCFTACEGEPLVMLRIGTPNESALGLDGRVDTKGGAFDPSKDVKAAPIPVFIEGSYFG